MGFIEDKSISIGCSGKGEIESNESK